MKLGFSLPYGNAANALISWIVKRIFPNKRILIFTIGSQCTDRRGRKARVAKRNGRKSEKNEDGKIRTRLFCVL